MRRLSASLITLPILLIAQSASAQTADPKGSTSAQSAGSAGTTSVGGTVNAAGGDVQGQTGVSGDTKPGDAKPGDPKAEDGKDPNAGPQPTPAVDQGSAGARTAGMLPSDVNYGNFMDTRLTWSFGDDDFLHKTGELVPLSPTFSVGDRQQYRLFFDNLNSRFAGRENLTHLVMYKRMPAFIDRLTTEAAVVLRFDLAALASNSGNLNQSLYDSGSYIRLFYQVGANERSGLSATFFPLDTDRFRLGYLYDITWGGTAQSINQSIFPRIQGSSPGMKLQYDIADKFYGFLGFKTATIVQPETVIQSVGTLTNTETVRVGETNYGFLGGFGVDPSKNFRFDAGGGYFQQGKFDLDDVRGKPVYTYGGSARVVVHDSMPVPQSVDFLLYKNDPMKPMLLFKPEVYNPGTVAWSVSAEGSLLEQHLKDFDTAGATKDQAAYAGAIQGVVKAGFFRVSATGIYRNLNFVVRSVPGFIPFETLPKSANTDAELFGALAADYYIQSLRLTPGLGGGVQLPSTFKSEFTDGGVKAERTIVVRQQGDESILPYNAGRSAIFQMRANVKWDISPMLAAVVWAQFVRDNNGTLVVTDPTQGSSGLRVFQDPNRFGLGTSLQARF
jgi:hypothetical protein